MVGDRDEPACHGIKCCSDDCDIADEVVDQPYEPLCLVAELLEHDRRENEANDELSAEYRDLRGEVKGEFLFVSHRFWQNA